MTKKKTPKKSSTKPVIYVHAKARSAVSSSQVQALVELDFPVYTRLAVEGARQTSNGYDQPLRLLAELHSEQPGRPVIFLRAGLQPTRLLVRQLQQLARAIPASVLVPLSNADALVNPFAGLQAPAKNPDIDYSGMVNLLAPGKLHTLNNWFDHFTYLTAEVVKCLAEAPGDIPLLQQLSRLGIRLLAPDHLFLHDPESKVFTKLDLKPYESL
ncbi:MAG: hypothetical protein OQJ84_10145, partial [Xanthomonadales bacterium]|nr:hypothetical protein [Xanthomonadales bacterium]